MARDNGNKRGKVESKDFRNLFVDLTVSVIVQLVVKIIIIGSIGAYLADVAQSELLSRVAYNDKPQCDGIPFYDETKSVRNVDAQVVKEYGGRGFAWMAFQRPTAVEKREVNFDIAPPVQSDNNWERDISMKSTFDYIFNTIASVNESSPIGLYYGSMISDLIIFNNKIVNFVFRTAGVYLPKWLIMIIFSGLALYYYLIVGLVNICASIFMHFSKINHIFRKKDLQNKGKWDCTDQGVKYLQWMRIGLLFIVMMLSYFTVFIVGGLGTIYAAIIPFLISYKIVQDGDGDDTTGNIFSFIYDNILVNKQVWMIIFSLLLIGQTQTSLGSEYMAAPIIAILVAIYMHFFEDSVNVLNIVPPV